MHQRPTFPENAMRSPKPIFGTCHFASTESTLHGYQDGSHGGDPAVPALPAPLPTEKLRDAVDLIVVSAVGEGQKLVEKLAQPGRVPGKEDSARLEIRDAEELKDKVVKKFEKIAPEFVRWLEENVDEGLTVFDYPRSWWKRIRTINGLERLNREIRRRTRVVGIFPHEASALRLISAVLAEIHEEWLTRSYPES